MNENHKTTLKYLVCCEGARHLPCFILELVKISTNCGIENAETKKVYPNYILSYDLSFLLTKKLEAFLQRDLYKGSSQTVSFKGRDSFDIVWFIQRSAKSDLPLKPDWSKLESDLKLEKYASCCVILYNFVEDNATASFESRLFSYQRPGNPVGISNGNILYRINSRYIDSGASRILDPSLRKENL